MARLKIGTGCYESGNRCQYTGPRLLPQQKILFVITACGSTVLFLLILSVILILYTRVFTYLLDPYDCVISEKLTGGPIYA